tara:strand:- start:1246 stop:1383 length:138 start_codon:yes stop_codon:yes gene_type:complete
MTVEKSIAELAIDFLHVPRLIQSIDGAASLPFPEPSIRDSQLYSP